MDRPLQRGNFVENTGKTGSDYQYGYNHSSSSFGPVEQQTADPFCFDERKLYYGGYSVDNGKHILQYG